MSKVQPSEPLRIVLIEDSEHECLAFKRTFQKCGMPCEIIYFKRAEEALKRLRTDPSGFDIVVCDYKLPGISGLECFREYHTLNFTQPFVIMTGCGSEQLAVDVLKAGVVDYLIKDPGRYYLELLPVQLQEIVRKHNDRMVRKQIEESLRNSERRLADIIDFLPDATFAIDVDGKIIIWNRTAEQFTGVKAEDILGKDNYEYAIPFYGTRRPLLIDLIFKPSEEIESLYPYIRKDGDLIQGEAYTRSVKRGEAYMFGVAAPLYDSEGRVVGAIESVRDITDRKREEEALFNSRQMLKLVLDSIPQRVFWKDRNLAYVGCNKPLARDCGYEEPEDLVGKTDFDTTSMEMAERYRADDQQVIDTGIPKLDYEEPQRKADGSMGLLRSSKLPLRAMDGRVIGILGVYEDITGRRMMEEELLKIQKLESVALLAGGIAHDYNNVLTSILGNISLAKLLVSPSDKIYQRLEAAEQASFRAKNLTKRLITFACGGAPVRRVISIEKVVRDSTELALSGSKCSCEYVLPDDLWSVEADDGQLSQVISNIVLNAELAMPNGGKVIVSCRNVLVDAADVLPLNKGRYVRIDIEDQGGGIAGNNLGKIFDPYFTTRESGKGLGLTLAYSIIKKHDGHISVSSTLGAGSIFSIYLPASESAAVEEKQEESEAISGNGRILVMDDEEIVRLVLGEILQHLGYEVGFSTNGREAIDMYSNAVQSGNPFDTVIMDLTIPGGMGGKEAVGLLKELYPDARVIVSSGYSNDPVMSHFKDYGFSGMVLKPYEVEELAKTLNDVLVSKA
jgi:PAS domain S-box-containing protein